jgi:Protein of unknown function (DUF2726)
MMIIEYMEPFLILTLFAGFLAAIAATLLLGFARSPRHFACEPMQTQLVPYRRRSFLFSSAERSFYQVLRGLVPDHMIFVKVRLSDLVAVRPVDPSFWYHFSPINRKLVDFVVCDPTLSPVVAIELEHDTHRESRHPEGEDLINSVLTRASLPVVHIPERRRYLVSELRRLLAPYLPAPAPLI